MDLTPEERERIYQEEKVRIEARQRLEKQIKGTAVKPSPHEIAQVYNRSTMSSGISFLGASLLIVGLAIVIFYACVFSVTVPVNVPTGLQSFTSPGMIPSSVNNIGLMSDRQNGIIIGGILVFIGTGLLITGLVLGLNGSNHRYTALGVYSAVLSIAAIITVGIAANVTKSSSLTRESRLSSDAYDGIAKDRLKQIGIAMVQYIQDYDEKYPPMNNTVEYEHAILPYLHNNNDAFIDPVSNAAWSFNDKFSGIELSKLQYISCDIFAYSPQANMDGSYYSLFADGHFKKIGQADWDTVKDTKVFNADTIGTLIPQ